MKQNRNWVKTPKWKDLVRVMGLWFFGTLLSMAAATDMFRESFLQRKNLVIFFMIIIAFGVVVRKYNNYTSLHKKES